MLVLVALGGERAQAWLEYRRAAILAGEVWRLFTGHLVHAGLAHLVMNLAALLLLWTVAHSWLASGRGAVAVAGLMLGTSVALLLTQPSLEWYVGLSGVLHGIALLAGWRRAREGQVLGWILLAALAAKLVWEALSPESPSAEIIGVPVIASAHLWGAATGALLACLEWWRPHSG